MVGDLLAHIDIFSVIFLISIIGRVAFALKQVAAHALRFARSLWAFAKRLDFRSRHSWRRLGLAGPRQASLTPIAPHW